jgi:cysteinyl-tRNA synthetase
MALNLYNTKTKSVEVFTPINSEKVTMYACGPTVYDYTHIGHMRKYVGDDILRRTLMFLGYKVHHVMNITDVGHLSDDADTGEDKMEKGAAKTGKTVWEVAQFYTDYFNDTMRAINVLPPTFLAKATDHVPSMIGLIQKLEARGATYETSQAVYFDIHAFPAYGALSGQKLSDKEVGVRDDVIVDPDKKHPQDFVLWFKCVGKFAHHTMHWASPWGDGFPGWHIECSAMSMEQLGETIDIHTGGIDHIPVHHENEIAQSECATGHTFVNYWVHHDFLRVDGEKMSKSKSNFYTIDDIRTWNIDPRALRMLFLQTSYRKPLNFTRESLDAAAKTLRTLDIFVASHRTLSGNGKPIESYIKNFKDALSEDLNTAKALSVVWEILADKTNTPSDILETILVCDSVFGFGLNTILTEKIPLEVTNLAEERQQARLEKAWDRADELRTQISAIGYTVNDTDTGYIVLKN